MKRNEISNVSCAVGSAGSLVVIAIGIGIFNALHVNASVQNNNWGLSAFNAFGAAAEIALAAPWFIFEKRRPGLPCPGNMNIIQAGIWQLYRASKDIWKLKQSLAYLIGKLIHLSFMSTDSQKKRSLLPPWRRPQHDLYHRLHPPE